MYEELLLTEILEEIRLRAVAWRDQEMRSLWRAQDDEARSCRQRAAVLEQLATDLRERGVERKMAAL